MIIEHCRQKRRDFTASGSMLKTYYSGSKNVKALNNNLKFTARKMAISFFCIAGETSSGDLFRLTHSSGSGNYLFLRPSFSGSTPLLYFFTKLGWSQEGVNLDITPAGSFRGKLWHYYLYFDNNITANNVEIWINGKKIAVGSLPNADNFSLDQDLYQLEIGGAGLNMFDTSMAHFTVFNRALTEAELHYIYKHMGVLPASVHANCLAHYPLQANFIRTVWDVVEQYNYKKPPREKNGNFDTGLDHWAINQENGALGTISHDTVEKAARLEYTGKDTTNPYSTYGGALSLMQSNFLVMGETYTLKFRMKKLVDKELKFFPRLGWKAMGLPIPAFNVWTSYQYTSNFESGPNALQFTMEGTTETNQLLVGDAVLIDNVELTHANNQVSAQNGELQNYTDAEIGLPDIQTASAWIELYSKQSNNFWLDKNADGTPDKDPGGFLIEKKTELPIMVNGLKLNGTNQYLKVESFNPTLEKGYTINFAFSYYANVNFVSYASFFSKRSTALFGVYTETNSKQITFWRNGSGLVIYPNNSSDVTKINFYSLVISPPIDINGNCKIEFYENGRLISTNTAFVPSLDTINAPLQIGFDNGHYFKGSLLHLSMLKGNLTKRQMFELSNNTLLSQPAKNWINLEWELLPDFNRIIDNTATTGVFNLVDLSGKSRSIEAVNYTAANLDPADSSYALVKIKDLH